MLKDRRPENALLAVANRAGHHAIVAPDAGGKTVQKGLKILNQAFEFLKKGVSLFRPLRDDFIDRLTPRSRLAFYKRKDPLPFDLFFQFVPDLDADLLV